jgi:hypothetical protein
MENIYLNIKQDNSDRPYYRLLFSDLSLEEKLVLMWGWLWRSLCVTTIAVIIAAIAGGIIGASIGMLAVIMHKNIAPLKFLLQSVGFTVGLFIGFLSLGPLIKWITNAKYGRYQIWILTNEPSGQESISEPNPHFKLTK